MRLNMPSSNAADKKLQQQLQLEWQQWRRGNSKHNGALHCEVTGHH
jgi:poly(3-hydroxyalkanoate) synthetase